MIITYLMPLAPKRQLTATANAVVIGRPPANMQIDLDLTGDPLVSRLHARIFVEQGQYWVEDLGSTNGTWVNGRRITTKTALTAGAKIQVGQTHLELQIDGMPEGAKTDTDALTQGTIIHAVSAAQPLFATPGTTSLHETLEQTQLQLKAFYEISQALGMAETPEQLLQTLTKQLQLAIRGAEHGAVLLRNEVGKLLLKAHWPPGEPSVSRTLAQRACDEHQAFIWTISEKSKKAVNTAVLQNVQAAIYAPLRWEGQVLGVVCVDNHTSRAAFTRSDLELLRAISNQTAMFIKNHTLRQELRREEEIRANLRRHFSPAVANRLLNGGAKLRLGGERMDPVTILVSDVRGFTALSAQVEADDIVPMLNDMFYVLTPLIFKYDGMVDRYIGDSLLAVFGCPEPDEQQWERAVRAALDMQHEMRKLEERWRGRGLPIMEIGIGIHTGEVVHGFIGSPDQMEYTVIGSTVNLADRYCDGADKREVVISPEVYQHIYRLVEVTPKTIQTKHPDTEPLLQAYVVKSLKEEVDATP
jgi:adenylate cyclase